MENKLSDHQIYVLERMRKAGLEWVASATETSWKRGEGYYIDSRCKTPQGLRREFQQGNKEAAAKVRTHEHFTRRIRNAHWAYI